MYESIKPVPRIFKRVIPMSASDITSLVSIITAAASKIESFYKDRSPKPVPTLDDVDPHPLDVGICPLEVKHSVQMLEGACAQLCAVLSRPDHTMLNVRNYLCGEFSSSDSPLAIFKGTTKSNSSPGSKQIASIKVFEPACLGVVLRARVADILLDKPSGLSVSEIGAQCGIEPRKLSRVLRTLCSTHIFREGEFPENGKTKYDSMTLIVTNDVFANNRLSMQLVSSTPMWCAGMHM